MLSYTSPQISELSLPGGGGKISVLHEYENHATVSGNKWWKLKENLEQARKEKHDTILTFGGAYSNHIYATAAAAKEYGFKSIGIIRGEEVENKTLSFARSCGMELVFVSREEYRLVRSPEGRADSVDSGALELVLSPKGRADTIDSDNLRSTSRVSRSIYVIPEGGTNDLAVEACAEWGRKLSKLSVDKIYVPVGTAGTISGLICGIDAKKEIIGVPVLKNEGFLEKRIEELTTQQSGRSFKNWRLINDYHFGGYGKSSYHLDAFCNDIRRDHNLVIEPVYTGKLFWAVFDQLKKGLITQGSKILVIHTGGLQYLP